MEMERTGLALVSSKPGRASRVQGANRSSSWLEILRGILGRCSLSRPTHDHRERHPAMVRGCAVWRGRQDSLQSPAVFAIHHGRYGGGHGMHCVREHQGIVYTRGIQRINEYL